MKKILLFVSFLVYLGMSDVAFANQNTHLRMSPGKVVIEEPVQTGKEIYIQRYYIKNASSETKVVRIEGTGYLKVKKEEVSIKPNERYYFDVKLYVPKGINSQENSDYVVAKTTHSDGIAEIKLSGKVEYKTESSSVVTKIIDSIWFFIALIFMLTFILIGLTLRRKRKHKKENEKNKEVDVEMKEI